MTYRARQVAISLFVIFGAFGLVTGMANSLSGQGPGETLHGNDCRLRVIFVGRLLLDGAINYAVTSDSLVFPKSLSEVDESLLNSKNYLYMVSEDRTRCILSCQHSDVSGTASPPYPFFTEVGFGLSQKPITAQVFHDALTQDITPTLSQYLSIPPFAEHYQVRNFGSLKVLAIKPDPGKPEIVVEILNPDASLKHLQLKFKQKSAYSLSPDDLADIVKNHQVEDPFVLRVLQDHVQ